MSDFHDNGGLFSRIFNFIFGSSSSKDASDHSQKIGPVHHGADEHGAADSKLKLVVSQHGENSSDMLNKIAGPPILASTPTMFDKAHTTDSPFHNAHADHDSVMPGHEDHVGAVNQNTVSFMDHLPSFNDGNFSHLSTSNDDVLNNSIGSISKASLDVGRIVSADNIPAFENHIDHTAVANDAGHNVVLDASDILNMGNNLIITGNQLDSVNFQDEGWLK